MYSRRLASSKLQDMLIKIIGQLKRSINIFLFPSALVELGFIANSSDAIALGIQDYYNWKN